MQFPYTSPTVPLQFPYSSPTTKTTLPLYLFEKKEILEGILLQTRKLKGSVGFAVGEL